MSRKKPTARVETVLYDVIYEDGTRSSNRKILVSLLQGPEGAGVAQTILETQDKEVAERSGRPRAAIKSVERSGK